MINVQCTMYNVQRKIKNIQKNYAGLTLIEVLVAMGIATVAGVLLVVIMVNSLGLYSKQSSKVQEGLNINDSLAMMRGSIKQASAIASQSGTTQLVLKVASIDSANNIIANTYDNFVFSLDQKFLRFKIFPDVSSSRKAADQIFSNSVDSLKLQYFNSANPPVEVTPVTASRVRISMTLKQSIATSEANLRND